ncbi:MAG: hypothetical protein IPK79_08330 [Vampirovibrionales bacterium]|nr:hypothetical protein [Vampirovibrionales bacterium]
MKTTAPMFCFWGAVACFVFGYLAPALFTPDFFEFFPSPILGYCQLTLFAIITILSLISIILNKSWLVKIISILLFAFGLISTGGMLLFAFVIIC